MNVHASPDHLRPAPLWRSLLQTALWRKGSDVMPIHRRYQQPASISSGEITVSLIARDLIETREVYVVDFEDGILFDQVDHVAIEAVSVESSPTVEDVFLTISSKRAENLLIVVNIDTMPDITEAVNRLCALKLARPDVPVIIASKSFSKNDFTKERRSIADASVRLPCSCAALALAIKAGVLNSKS